MKQEHFFLGSASPDGFILSIDSLLSDTSCNVFILKGTAGSGKSTFMKKISEAFKNSDQEIYHCSADPHSLDAVFIKDNKTLIVDGTSPHCIDPVYPKAVDSIIDLGTYIDASPLRNAKKEIIAVTHEYGSFHKRCRLCLSAISSVMSDMINAANTAILYDKLESFTKRIFKRCLPKKSAYGSGKIIYKQLAAITMNGYSTYIPDTYEIYLLSDDSLAASRCFLRSAAKIITDKGYDIIISRCLLSNEHSCEHILIPELNIAFLSSDCINQIVTDNPKKIINFKRFYDKNIMSCDSSVRQRIKFGKKAANELLLEASAALKTAKSIHDKLESYYISAADFNGINRLLYKVISEIKSLH